MCDKQREIQNKSYAYRIYMYRMYTTVKKD